MIDPKSLRIGNKLFNDKKEVITVRGIEMPDGYVYEEGYDRPLYEGQYHPIPLSEQELIRLGFHKESDTLFTYGNKDTSLCLTARSTGGFKDGGYFLGIRYDDWDQDPINIHNFIFDIKFVHRLQNAFDDMDIELTYPTEPDTKELKQ